MLNREARSALEKIIDKVIGEIPQKKRDASDPQTKSEHHIESVDDYVIGWAAGKIEGMFGTYFINTYQADYGEEERREVSEVMFKRMAEIRNAIFSAG